MLRRCEWNHKDLPYKPSSPCILLYFIPGNPLPRGIAPNARGEFPSLVPGLPYREWCLSAAESLGPIPITTSNRSFSIQEGNEENS